MPLPTMRIEGDNAVFGEFGNYIEFVLSGDMATNFEEGYSVDIQAKDKAAEGGGQPGQTPHPPNMNFDKGQFDNTQWVVTLFSGVIINDRTIYKGSELVAVAELLFKLSMPRAARGGKAFVGPPLVNVYYGNFWKARGLFQKVRFISKGLFDTDGDPLLLEIHMEFARHFGGNAGLGGIYDRAKREDLVAKATAQNFAFRPKR